MENRQPYVKAKRALQELTSNRNIQLHIMLEYLELLRADLDIYIEAVEADLERLGE